MRAFSSTLRLSPYAVIAAMTVLTGCGETQAKPAAVPSGSDNASNANSGVSAKPDSAPSPPKRVLPKLREDAAWVAPQNAPDWGAFDKAVSLTSKPKATCPSAKPAKSSQPVSAAAPTCSNATEVAQEFSRVLQLPPASIDAELARLEPCAAASPGMIRALRAELAPTECADALTDPLLAPHPTNMEPAVAHQLVGLSLAAKLSRLVTAPPELKGKADKKSVAAYLAGPQKQWFEKQARTIEALAGMVARSERSCGQGIAAVQAGVADMQFVDLARRAPIPAEWKNDRELQAVYFGSLDELLEPRKARGRDAALFGLDVLAQCGYVQDARVTEARSLLESLYAGKRVVALSGIVLPPRATAAPNPLFMVLPPFYADRLVGTPDPAALVAWSVRGMPPAARASLEGRLASVPPESRALYARARLASGLLHVRGVDFDRALNATFTADDAPLSFEAALAAVLRKGPASAAELMRVASASALQWHDTSELDEVAARDAPDAPYAEYDAAYLTLIAPPAGAAANAAFFLGLKAHFDHVASKTTDAALQSLARKRSLDMTDTAKAAASIAPANGSDAPPSSVQPSR